MSHSPRLRVLPLAFLVAAALCAAYWGMGIAPYTETAAKPEPLFAAAARSDDASRLEVPLEEASPSDSPLEEESRGRDLGVVPEDPRGLMPQDSEGGGQPVHRTKSSGPPDQSARGISVCVALVPPAF